MRERLVSAIDYGARRVGAVTTLSFATIVVYAVAARYLFGRTPSWAEELPRLLLVWLCFIGAISCFARNSHFRAGFMQLLVKSPGLRRALEILSFLATMAMLVLLVWTGWKLTQLTWNNQTTALRLPVGLFYLSLSACGVVSIIVLLLRRDMK